MYKVLIKEYIKKLSLKDINDFALKYNYHLKDNEDKIIYEFIINNWEDIYDGNDKSITNLKNKVSNNTYNMIINIYNEYKSKIKKSF